MNLDALIKSKSLNWTDLLDTPISITANDFVRGNGAGTDLVQFDLFAASNIWTANNLFSSTNQIQFRDDAIHISSIDDGHLDLTADISIDINAPLADFGSGNILTTGKITGAGYHVSVVTISSADYTLTENDDVVLFSTGGVNRTATLPSATTVLDKVYHIKKISSGAGFVTIDPDGTETIDGDLTVNISIRYESLMIVSDGSNWHVI